MKNLTNYFIGRAFAKIWEGLQSQKMQLISTKDVGSFAADALLSNPSL